MRTTISAVMPVRSTELWIALVKEGLLRNESAPLPDNSLRVNSPGDTSKRTARSARSR